MMGVLFLKNDGAGTFPEEKIDGAGLFLKHDGAGSFSVEKMRVRNISYKKSPIEDFF